MAFETDGQGEFAQPVEVRLEALKAAAPFCRPKLQAVVHKSASDGQGHAKWLEELATEINGHEVR